MLYLFVHVQGGFTAFIRFAFERGEDKTDYYETVKTEYSPDEHCAERAAREQYAFGEQHVKREVRRAGVTGGGDKGYCRVQYRAEHYHLRPFYKSVYAFRVESEKFESEVRDRGEGEVFA